MLQTFYGQNAASRTKGTLCFSSNYSAVIFVRDADSDGRTLNWNLLTDSDTFAEFRLFFDLRTTKVENSFHIDADASDVSRWLDQRDDQRTSDCFESTDFSVDVSNTSATRDGVIDITSVANIPSEWRHTPIEVLIKGVNFRLTGESRHSKLCLVTCESHTPELAGTLSNLEITEIAKTSFRASTVRSLLSLLSSREIRHAVVLGHVCVGLASRSKEAAEIFEALVGEGWSPEAARDYLSPRFPIFDEISSLRKDYELIRKLCKYVQVAPLFINHFTKSLQIPTWYRANGTGYSDSDDHHFDLGN